jgi:hypothetical protein
MRKLTYLAVLESNGDTVAELVEATCFVVCPFDRLRDRGKR